MIDIIMLKMFFLILRRRFIKLRRFDNFLPIFTLSISQLSHLFLDFLQKHLPLPYELIIATFLLMIKLITTYFTSEHLILNTEFYNNPVIQCITLRSYLTQHI